MKEKDLIDSQDGLHLKHQKALKLLQTARGQLNSVVSMVQDERYCIDVSMQLLATISLLKRANTEIINRHIETCVREASQQGDFDNKIAELEQLMRYLEKTL